MKITEDNNLWIDARLNQEEMDFLHQAISETKESGVSTFIDDKDNWFFETTLKELTEKLFYDDWDNYRKYHIKKDESPPKFEMDRFWVNYQKQYQFNPLHDHSGLFSFVVFMKIPTHWKEQHALNFDNFRAQVASDFMFVWSEHTEKFIRTQNFPLSAEDEGRMLFFPTWLEHQVYPFYGTEEDRITISGNICEHNPVIQDLQKKWGQDEVEIKENMLKMLENSVETTKKELQQMKKMRE